jgi:uncharacterized protein YndB with AHSA1/START domain
MALQIGIGVLVLVALLVLFVGTRPASFHIERSKEIEAPSERVFALLNDFHEWAKWSPWEKLDPAMKKTFEGPTAGKGASYGWVGNSKAGSGRMTILESSLERVSIELEFIKPFPAKNRSTFELKPSAKGTAVRWIMEGENGFSAKAFSLLVNMDKFLGKDFEEGLAKLDSAARSA